MYFLEEGAADAIVRGVSVFSYTRGGHFGELALLTDEPRKATVRAGSAGAQVWRLDRTIFEETLNLSNRDKKWLSRSLIGLRALLSDMDNAKLDHDVSEGAGLPAIARG